MNDLGFMMRRGAIVAAALVGALAVASVAVAAPKTKRVSVSSSGVQGNDKSGSDQGNQGTVPFSTSANGRIVAFPSDASNLVAGDTNGVSDAFVRNLKTGRTRRVSVRSSGAQANDGSYFPSISPNGRFVTFYSDASNLAAGDTNGVADIFVRNLKSGKTKRVSVRSSGAQGNDGSYQPSISANGRFVTFTSSASNLVAGDTNGEQDVFVRNLKRGKTRRVSISSSGVQGNDGSFSPAISPGGRSISFGSVATNLVSGDTNGANDVFVRKLRKGKTRRVSVSSSGAQATDGSFGSTISAGGRFVTFVSYASNLVAGDTNDARDVFVRNLKSGKTWRVSVSSSGAQGNGDGYFHASISADGRFVVFSSDASNLVAGDTNDDRDVFVRDRKKRKTRRVSVSSSGAQGSDSSFSEAISANGRFVVFFSFASNLVFRDTNGVSDVFRRGPLR